MKTKKAIVVTHTHWDREWRYPLWKNRVMLVDMIDHLLRTLNTNPDYVSFMLDGQSVIIEDYLEICPDREDELKKYIKEERIKIGPWYTLPDLFPLDGECLIRNLLKGIRYSNSLGGYQKTAYNSFGWGQIAQFPQIYNQFGFTFLIAAKRISKERAPFSEFLWVGPDSSEIMTSRLGVHTRANFFFDGYIPIKHGIDYFNDEEYRFNWSNHGTVLHNADINNSISDYFKISIDSNYYKGNIKTALIRCWENMSESLSSDYRLIMDGSDFTFCQPEIPAVLKDANECFEDIEWIHGTLDEATNGILKNIVHDNLKKVTGELRDGPASHVSANALTSRMYLKILNKEAENIIIRKAEPLASFNIFLGISYPANFLNKAWEYMLKAHPHDSINGVTQDRSADDTLYRLNQAIQIGTYTFEKSIADLISRINMSDYSKEDILILLVNTSQYSRNEITEATIDLPAEYNIWEFELIDNKGGKMKVQPVARQEKIIPINDFTSRPWPFFTDTHHIYFETGVIPAYGYKVLKIRTVSKFNRLQEWWAPMRKQVESNISPAPNILENKYLKAIINGNGSLGLTSKESCNTYSGIHLFYDEGDAGDFWAYYPPYHNENHTNIGMPARIWCEENGPLAASYKVEIKLELPKDAVIPVAGIRGESKRSEETAELRIITKYTLKKDSKQIDVSTTVFNNTRNHRLRLLFPTDLIVTKIFSAGHFYADERSITPTRLPDGSYYPEMQTQPMQMFVSVIGETGALSILNNCFTEYEFLDDTRSTLAITLFRSVENRICTEFRSTGNFKNEDGGQSLRKMEYNYAIYPHSSSWSKKDSYASAMSFNTPLSVFQTSAHSKGWLPDILSFLSIEPDSLIITAIKKAEDNDNIIIRFFNPEGDLINSELTFHQPLNKAWQLNLNEERITELPVCDNKLCIRSERYKIVTIEIEI